LAAALAASQAQSQLATIQAQGNDHPKDGDSDAADASKTTKATPAPGTGQVVDKYA